MIRLSTPMTQRGTITLLLLALMIMLILILSASLQLIAQQTHQTVDQQHKLETVDIADAGIQYTDWLLAPAPGGGNYTPSTLQANPPASATNHTLTDSDSQNVGAFTLSFPTACVDRLQVLSVAQDSNNPGLCQSVEATIQQDLGGVYRVTEWNQLVNTACTGVTVSSPLVCPTAAPTPTLTPLPT